MEALKESIRINFLAVGVTSATTIVGFLSLNASDSPPFWHLGNITAIGIAAAFVYSVTFMPAVVSLLPVRVRVRKRHALEKRDWLDRLGGFVEYFGGVKTRGEDDEHSVDGGFTWLVNDDLQLDLSAGVGLNHAAPDFFVSAGFAWRYRGR